MEKKLIFISTIIVTLMFSIILPLQASAESETENNDDNQAPPAQQSTPTPAPTPQPSITKIQSVNRMIEKTLIPPIAVTDNNQNGIVDEIENLYKK